MKKTLALMLALIMAFACLAGCEGAETAAPAGEGGGTDPYTGVAYAADTEYKYLYSSEITTLNYLVTSVTNNQHSLANFIDTLIEYDHLGNIVPCLAESWEVSDDGLVTAVKAVSEKA